MVFIDKKAINEQSGDSTRELDWSPSFAATETETVAVTTMYSKSAIRIRKVDSDRQLEDSSSLTTATH